MLHTVSSAARTLCSFPRSVSSDSAALASAETAIASAAALAGSLMPGKAPLASALCRYSAPGLSQRSCKQPRLCFQQT